MKQYLDKDQTAKLMELGFPRPKHSSSVEEFDGKGWAGHVRVTFDYSIGELIEFIHRWMIEIGSDIDWYVKTIFTDGIFVSEELIDALYEACKNLRERGKI